MADIAKTPQAGQPFTPIDQHLFEARTVFVTGEVNGDLAKDVCRQLLALERANAKAPVVLWIDSPGGEVHSGFGIYDTAQFIEPRVITVVSGRAWSMGSVISLAADKTDRVALPNAKFLIHQPLGGARGPASDIEIHARDLIELKRRLHRIYHERTGVPVERFIELMERDCWVNTDEAIELGLISQVVSSRKALDAILRR